MPELQPVPEDWDRALCIVAHPDDLEYGSASAIARWTDQGKEISYCLITSGEAGIDSMAPDDCACVRQEEERRSAAVVGREHRRVPRPSRRARGGFDPASSRPGDRHPPPPTRCGGLH